MTKVRKAKSPIETQLRNALVHLAEVEDRDISISDYSTAPDPMKLVVNERRGLSLCDEEPEVDEDYFHWGEGKRGFGLYANVAIASYRVDLLIKTTWDALLAIECDGHEWHERTKQQASADRARDRELLKRGLPVIRFTGSDIVYDAARCASEVIEIAMVLDDKAWRVIESASESYMRGKDEGALREDALHANRGVFAGCLSGVG